LPCHSSPDFKSGAGLKSGQYKSFVLLHFFCQMSVLNPIHVSSKKEKRVMPRHIWVHDYARFGCAMDIKKSGLKFLKTFQSAPKY
jgi:hypothetical protein